MESLATMGSGYNTYGTRYNNNYGYGTGYNNYKTGCLLGWHEGQKEGADGAQDAAVLSAPIAVVSSPVVAPVNNNKMNF